MKIFCLKKVVKILSLTSVLVFYSACSEKYTVNMSVTVKNHLDFDRNFETVEIDISGSELEGKSIEVKNIDTNETLISQIVEYNGTGAVDKVLLFQPKILANSEATFSINLIPSEKKIDSSLIHCYSRFVPERTDDYAWENNRVAFRTYGPTAQEMKEDGLKGGTLSSGMDAWLKRVDYTIINKWYKKHTSGEGSYHEDTGEGLDNFHVGVSRGVGGTAVKVDSTYAVSKNFTSWKTITNGPIRTAFILEYENWEAGEKSISETKYIFLDYGQNLSRYIVEIKGTNTVSAGLTLHNKDGEITTNTNESWMSYWEPYFDSELGQGIVLKDKKNLSSFDKYVTDKKDESNLYFNANVAGAIEYYAGFGWKKSGQFNSKEEWNNYLSRFSKCLDNPLEVTFNKTVK